VREAIDEIEQAYEFMAAYASQGQRPESHTEGASQIRVFLERYRTAADTISKVTPKLLPSNGPWHSFAERLLTDTRVMRLAIIAVSLALWILTPAWVHADAELTRAIGMALHNVQGDVTSVPDGPFNDGSHTCIGEKAIAVLGDERTRQLGITRDNAQKVLGTPPLTMHGLTVDEIEGLLDAVDQCIPFQEIWVFLAINARNTDKLIKTEEQRNRLAECVAVTPGREIVRDAWRLLFTQSTRTFQAAFSEMHQASMACFAEVFCGPAYVGAVITPGLFQSMITTGACPF
jgi:hypothetical protein